MNDAEYLRNTAHIFIPYHQSIVSKTLRTRLRYLALAFSFIYGH